MLLRSRKPETPKTSMGITHAATVVIGLDRSGVPFEAQFLVDTGAVDCLALTSLLERAGVQRKGRDLYELANGQTISYDYGYAWMTFIGTEIISKIIFGPEWMEPILGVIALEQAGFSVDPTTQMLKRMATRSLKRVA